VSEPGTLNASQANQSISSKDRWRRPIDEVLVPRCLPFRNRYYRRPHPRKKPTQPPWNGCPRNNRQDCESWLRHACCRHRHNSRVNECRARVSHRRPAEGELRCRGQPTTRRILPRSIPPLYRRPSQQASLKIRLIRNNGGFRAHTASELSFPTFSSHAGRPNLQHLSAAGCRA